MKNIIHLLTLLLSTKFISAQILKSYSGKFEDGTANYQYFENEKFDRVFHGSFSYLGSEYNMKGDFHNDKKNGKWEIYANKKLYKGLIINTKIFGYYKNGEFLGDWYYSNSIRHQNNAIEDKEISQAQFLNNHFIGSFNYKSNWPGNVIVNGKFDINGLQTGKWVYINDVIKDEMKFLNGVAYWRLMQDTTDGRKLIFSDNTNFVSTFWKSYDSTSKFSEINGEFFTLDTIVITAGARVRSSFDTDNYLKEICDISGYTLNGSEYRIGNPICVWLDESPRWIHYISNPLYYYDKKPIYPACFQLVIRKCEYKEINTYRKLLKDKEKEQKEKEDQKKENEEKSLSKKKFELLIENANKHLQEKKYREALAEFNSASIIDNTYEIIQKKEIINEEIRRIEKIQKRRYDLYTYLKIENDEILSQIESLKIALTSKKSIYGENYYSCMNLLGSNLSTYFLNIDSMFKIDKPYELKLSDVWNETDQKVLDLLEKLNEEFGRYEKFHKTIKAALENENNEKLKLLKSSNIPSKIIDVFN